jgi:hypothetical protein
MITHALASLLLLIVLVVLVALLLASGEAWKAMRSRPTQPWTSVSDPPRMKRDAPPHNRTKRRRRIWAHNTRADIRRAL